MHLLPGLPLRSAAYLVLTIMIVGAWLKFRRGLDTMRLVLNSRVAVRNADE